MFSPPIFLSVGDEYDKRGAGPPGGNGGKPPFVATARRSNHKTDAPFGKFVSLSAGDPYVSVGVNGTFRDGKVKPSDQPPFRPPNAAHKSSSKGDYYGTFSEKNPPKHEPEFPPLKRSGPTDTRARNFYTNPPKKGTYGYTGLTIAKAGEVQYVSDPYQGHQRSAVLEEKMKTSKHMGAPFRAAVRSGGCFDETEHGFSKVYSLSRPLAPKKSAPTEVPNSSARPWVPGGALTRDITAFPEYEEDPYDIKERKVREEKLKEQQYKAWNPVGTDPYRHIYTKPINYDPPAV